MNRNLARTVGLVGAVVLGLQTPRAGAAGLDAAAPNGRVEITFTKWLRASNNLFMHGVTGGDVEGVFTGEAFVNVLRANTALPAVSNLEVIYGVQATDPEQSFTALLRGGAALGRAQLDGRILAGWRIGSEVHVEWARFASPSENCPTPPADSLPFCFVGTITIQH
jgi:hypothetical protein